MTYAVENLAINEKYRSKILATEMEYMRSCCRSTRFDRVRNEEVTRTIETETDVLAYD